MGAGDFGHVTIDAALIGLLFRTAFETCAQRMIGHTRLAMACEAKGFGFLLDEERIFF